MEKRRQRLLSSGSRYTVLDNFYRAFLFESTDQIFRELSLKLLLLDINPHHCTETWDINIRNGLIKNLKTNNSLLVDGGEDCSLPLNDVYSNTQQDTRATRLHTVAESSTPMRFIEDTIVGETDILPFIISRQACKSPSDFQDYRQAAHDYIDASVVLGDQRRNLLMLLGSPAGPLHFIPIMGAAISLTGVEGETELRWGFSRLISRNESEARLRDELEGIFAYRLLAEGLFLEDLRVSRLSRRHGIVRSDRTKRFVSILSSDMFLFPRGFLKAYLAMEGLTRHYNLSSSLDLRHGPLCRCRRIAESAMHRQVDVESGQTKSNGAAATTRNKRVAPGSLASGNKAVQCKSADGAFRVSNTSPKKGCTDEEKIWSFYGISMFNFDRLVKAIYDARLQNGAKNDPCRSAICRRMASNGMRTYLVASSIQWAKKN